MIMYTVIILLGGLAGLGMEKIAIAMINKRVSQPVANRFSGSLTKTLLWAVTNALSWFLVVLIGGINGKTIECILILSACLVITAIDITIRKISNEIILFILIVGVIFVFVNNQVSSLDSHIGGFALGFAMFCLPSMIGRGAGWGDVKFAAVLGFCLGIYDFLTAVIIMTLILLLYTGYIIAKRKGNLKTKIALGPFMAGGIILVMIINILNTKWMIFDLQTFLQQTIS
jgi:Flp pilus assembly protein protease CpaA